MVIIIIIPPKSVSVVGCSLINSHTLIGPKIVSSKKNKLTESSSNESWSYCYKNKWYCNTHNAH